MKLAPILTLAVALAVSPVQGHHSVIGMYNPEMKVTLTGVVAEFHFVGPHPYVVLDADPDETGSWRWHLEFDSRRELASVGVTENTFRPGDELVVTGDYARDGTEKMYVRGTASTRGRVALRVPGLSTEPEGGALTY